MLERYRGIVLATGLIITSAIGAWIGISDLSTVDQSYVTTASDRSDYYRQQANEQVRAKCILAPGVEDPSCADKIDDAARKEQREEQDLAAQKVTAWWTKIMGIAAVIGMTLSAVGVALVYTTFQATREANKIGQDALMAEHRPRIVIRRVDFKQCERGIYGSFTATNIGGSDAIFHAAGCWIYCIKGPLPAIPPYEGKYRTYAGNILPLRAQPKSSRVRPRGTKMNSGDWMKFHFIAREFIEINNQDGYSYGPRYYIMGWVDYRQASGNYVRRTSFCREIEDGPSTTLKAVENPDYEHQD